MSLHEIQKKTSFFVILTLNNNKYFWKIHNPVSLSIEISSRERKREKRISASWTLTAYLAQWGVGENNKQYRKFKLSRTKTILVIVISDSLFCLSYRDSPATDHHGAPHGLWWRQGSQGIYTLSSPRLGHTHRLSGLQEFWKFANCIAPHCWISPKFCCNLLKTYERLLGIFLTGLTWEWKQLIQFWT